jgi:hypothetical protein
MYSLTQAGNLTALVGLLAMILKYFHINISEDEVQAVIGGIMTLSGIIISWIGRYRQGDIKLSGFKK